MHGIQRQLHLQRETAGRASSTVAIVFALALFALSAEAQPARTWTGQWIWDRPSGEDRNVYVYFRRSFSLAQSPAEATVYLTADSRYQIWVNGRFAGRGPVRAPKGRLYYDTYNIAPHLHSGENVLAVLVHQFGDGTEFYIPGRSGLLLDAELRTAPGSTIQRISTDASWRALRSTAWDENSPRENDGNGFLEIFDFRREPAGWNTTGFEDSGWLQPSVIGSHPMEPWPEIVARDIPFLTEGDIRATSIASSGEVVRSVPAQPQSIAEQVWMEPIRPVSSVQFANLTGLTTRAGPPAQITTPQDGMDAVIVLDFGRVIAGFPYVDVEGPAGAVVDISFSEWLRYGRVTSVKAPVKFLTYTGKRMYSTDRITLRQGRQKWQRFFHSSFRYLQLTVRHASSPVTIHATGALFHVYPFNSRGTFRSSDIALNMIWATGAYTVLLSTADAFMDCPWREKGQWMDMVTPLASYQAFGDSAIAARYLRTSGASQDADGRMYFPYPSSLVFELPDQTTWWVQHLWQYFLYFGDAALVQEQYPRVARIGEWFRQHRNARGLLDVNWSFPGDRLLWPWIDHGHRWPTGNIPGIKLGEFAAMNAFYYKFLVDAANLARVAGQTADAAAFENEAKQLKVSFNGAYWDESQKYYWDDPERTIPGDHASILAVLYGLAPADRQQQILNRLAASESAAAIGPHFYFFLLDALAKAGMHAQALDVVRIRWGGLLVEGATTWWEQWSVMFDLFGRHWPPEANHHLSLVHGYGAAPTYYLSTSVLGIRPNAPGFSKAVIAPLTGGLAWAEGTVPTPRGNISVSWRQEGATFLMTARTPTTVPAIVSLPRGSAAEIAVNGITIWRNGAVTGSVPGVRVLGPTLDRVVLDVTPGQYQFTSR